MADATYPILDQSTWHSAEEDGDPRWTHDACGSVLLAARVHHSIHDGPFPLSGSGQVQIEVVPYCPTCGPKPSEYGAPINVPFRA